ncbi:MAG: PD-(D/E)XK nuclease family protein [Desulfamplus sp.]|nr:PD-(D/E)XK nuclease family protein [Desulfamplus sp.]
MTHVSLQKLTNELHVSHSQISTYQLCSLKYYLHYVEAKKPESVGIALPFGGSLHSALAVYYRSVQHGKIETLDNIIDCFNTALTLDMESSDIPILFSKNMSDKDAALKMGKSMLEVFYSNVNLKNFEIVDVELPLSSPLYTVTGTVTDYRIIGVIDLLLRSPDGEILIVDNKSASKSLSQQMAEQDHQMTAYSYLLATNRYIPPASTVQCRFDVLLKLKEPKIQNIQTSRNRDHRRRFARLSNMVLAGIDSNIFFPNPSWMCPTCQYAQACSEW